MQCRWCGCEDFPQNLPQPQLAVIFPQPPTRLHLHTPTQPAQSHLPRLHAVTYWIPSARLLSATCGPEVTTPSNHTCCKHPPTLHVLQALIAVCPCQHPDSYDMSAPWLANRLLPCPHPTGLPIVCPAIPDQLQQTALLSSGQTTPSPTTSKPFPIFSFLGHTPSILGHYIGFPCIL